VGAGSDVSGDGSGEEVDVGSGEGEIGSGAVAADVLDKVDGSGDGVGLG
jgi:hypothetical protein